MIEGLKKGCSRRCSRHTKAGHCLELNYFVFLCISLPYEHFCIFLLLFFFALRTLVAFVVLFREPLLNWHGLYSLLHLLIELLVLRE
jgi:hypothetical protein